MKKFFFSAAASLTLLFAASCQKENFSGADGEFATVTLTVQAPASPSTKALGDGTKAKNLVFGVFDETGAELTDLRQGDWMNANQTEITFNEQLQATLTVNLAKGKTYTFICWAQTKEYGDAANPTAVTCYDFKNLADIKVDYTVNNEANNEHRDAFYACVTSGIVKQDYETTITLTRPFGQLNIGTDDMAAAQSAGLDLENLWVELSVTNCPTHLVADMDKHNYTVDGLTTAKFTKALCPASVNATETLDVDVNSDKTIADSEKYVWLSMNYIFTAHQDVKDDTPKTIAFDIYEGDLSLVKYKRDNVPFLANYRTNLLGRLLTTDGDITVIIDPVPTGDENITGGIEDVSVITIAELNAVTASGTYNVGGTITKDGVQSANGAGYEDVEINDGENTATYTLKIPTTKAEGEYEAYYKTGGYLIVAVDVEVDDNGEIQRTSRDTHVAYVPNTEDEEEAPVEPILSLELATDEPVSAGGGSLHVKVTSNVAWTLALDGETVMEGKEAVTDQEIEVIVPKNEGSEMTHTLLLSNVPAEGTEAVTATATFTQAAAEAVTPEEPEVKTVTVAEFLEAAVDEDVFYTLKGTITRVANTTYGNFDLTDDTGTVYIYGLMSEDGATSKYWASSGAQLGDDIVISVPRADYNGTPQGTNARFIELNSPGTRAFYTLSTEAVEFASAGGEQVVTVSAYNTDAAVTALSDNEKFTASVDGYNVTISSKANELEEEITGNVTVKVGDLEPVVVKVSLAAKPASGVVEGGKADFNTISSTSTSYVKEGSTTAGWAYANCAIFKGGTSNSSPAFVMIGGDSDRALCMNGKTTAQGTITSPVLTTGCGTLTFNYGLPFTKDKIEFSVDIIQNGESVKTFTVKNQSPTQYEKYSFEETVNVDGEFQIVFKNLSPSGSTSNKDRTAIWNVEWTGYSN